MDTKPIVTPLLKLLHSRRFMVLLLSLIVFFLIPTIPDQWMNDAWKDRLAQVVFYGAGIVIVGLSGEDLLAAYASGKALTLKDLLIQLLEEGMITLEEPEPVPAPVPVPTVQVDRSQVLIKPQAVEESVNTPSFLFDNSKG